jgi:hypothetical protein
MAHHREGVEPMFDPRDYPLPDGYYHPTDHEAVPVLSYKCGDCGRDVSDVEVGPFTAGRTVTAHVSVWANLGVDTPD